MSVTCRELEYFDSHYLNKCQVDTPLEIVEFVWSLVYKYRKDINKVLDLGAGDGKFSLFGSYSEYVGYEIDSNRAGSSSLPPNACLRNECAITYIDSDFDLCIGNPPYVRHHDLNDEWQKKIASDLSNDMGFRLDRRSNAFIYFLCQAILKTKRDGLVVQLIPYEWVSRPASKFLRGYIKANNWSVSVYRFEQDVFAHSKVLTTACITVIDKSIKHGRWAFYSVDRNLNCRKVDSPTGYENPVLEYIRRGEFNFAQRGLSPGGQKVFCLTEETREKFGLTPGLDVFPCVTNLKCIESDLKVLNMSAFRKHYIKSGERCWLISSDPNPTDELMRYLQSVDEKERDNYTCRNQSPWWGYRAHKSPDILYGSGFTSFGPKVVVNMVGAIALGTVHGVHKVDGITKLELRERIASFDFEKQVVSHSGALKKVEVNQMNYVLSELTSQESV